RPLTTTGALNLARSLSGRQSTSPAPGSRRRPSPDPRRGPDAASRQTVTGASVAPTPMRLPMAWSGARLREHVGLSALFLIGRALIDLAGLKLNFVLDWMFLADPQDLRSDLVRTVFYAHASPPGMNLLTG